MGRPHRIEPGQWIDLDDIARLWVVDFDPQAGQQAKVKAVPLQFIAWVATKGNSMIELGRFGDRKDAVDRIETLAKLWVSAPKPTQDPKPAPPGSSEHESEPDPQGL